MSNFAETHLPCPDCGSSDALSVYHSGVKQCFSCGTTTAPDGDVAPKSERAQKYPLHTDLNIIPLTKRGLLQETCQRYGYGINGAGYQCAPYYNKDGRIVAQKVRGPDKKFMWSGDPEDATLFGRQLMRTGGRMVVITEGEIDAMSVSQALGNTWPCVSVPNGAQGAKSALQTELELLCSYDKVVLCFDADDAGQKAIAECVELFPPGKVAIANLGTYKDANEMVAAGEANGLRQIVWDAQVWRPDGVVNLSDIKDRVRKPLDMGKLYPWKGLNEKLFGYRPGELITWTAGTGVGKTTIVSELIYGLMQSEKERIGVIFLEEGIDMAGKRLVGIHMNQPLHLPTAKYTDKQFDKAWDATLGRGNVFAYDHFGSLDEDILLNRIRYMAKGLDCKTIILDHVSMVVSGADLDADERRMLDHIVTNLVQLTQETGATIHMVSHLRRPPGQGTHEEGRQVSLSHLRGTQAIAQLSHAVIACERDQQADTDEARNTTTLRVLKNRYAGLTGPATALVYNPETGRLSEISSKVPEDMGKDY